MIFDELISELLDPVSAAVEELFSAAHTRQTHPQDLLLLLEHGFYWPEISGADTGLSPYLIGTGYIGAARETFNEFMHWFRTSHLLSRSSWEEKVATDEESRKHERLTIQVEQGLYLRFWEDEWGLKRYYQLGSLALGKPYDWHLAIPSHARGGSKHEFIRKEIRNRIKDVCPRFYALVKDNYTTQFRNAIAHSQFSLTPNRQIWLLNHSPDPKAYAPQRYVSFDEWFRMLHTVLLLHSKTAELSARYQEQYRANAQASSNRLQVRITTETGLEKFEELGLAGNGRWNWAKNL